MQDDAEVTIALLREELNDARIRAEIADSSLSELRRSQELTRRLIEAMPGGVVHVGADGAILTANAEALRVLGFSYDSLGSKYTRDFDTHTLFEDGTDCPAEAYPVTRALVTGEAQPPITIGVRRPDGQTSWAVFTAVPIKADDGTTTGAVVTFIDITRRKQLERELRIAQKLESLGRLAGGIAHDFNNLLTVIVANARSLHDALGPDDPRSADVDEVLHAADHAASLTRHLLEFARRQDVEPEVVALDALVAHTAAILRRVIGEHIELVLDMAPGVWPVRVDPGQFEQVLINLAVNARDAMPSGGTLTIRVHNGDADDVCLAVIDTGHGIDEATVERVFEPFFTTKEAGKGTGLGLATCYGIVQQAGGTIAVRSEAGHGTTFEVRLPRVDGEQPRAPEPAAIASQGPSATVMLVEDDPLVRKVVERGLTRRGFRVVTVDAGDAALAILAESSERIDVLLTDIVMPRMSGPELARSVRALRPEIRILFMSGFTDDAASSYGLAEDDGPLLRKPFQPAELIARIRDLLDGRDAD